ncbi:MAG: Tol-Pal system beta propeller repeat protein TolB [Thermodesulfobacteriota bacterium]|nr:Tol-Pal system beta propeller repeat protein TolB [Thermodesulfobacteriota bacterium]
MGRFCSPLRHFAIVALFLWVVAGAGAPCQARVYLDITAPYLRKIPTAVPVFKDLGSGDKAGELSRELAGLLAETIDFTGFFEILDRRGFLEDPLEASLAESAIPFKNWTIIGAELLVKGGFEYRKDRLKMELRLFDTFGGHLVIGKRYTGKLADQRRMIRRFCNDIVHSLTGHEGIFDTQIAFISTTTGHKEIYIADFDGYDPAPFTHTGTITLFPAWSSDGHWLAYTDYRNGKPDIYVRNIKEKQGTVISFKGSSMTPAWMPGKFALAASLSHEGNPNLYLLTGKGKIIKKLTKYWGIDVSPSWSPDGQRLTFVSNRSGNPQLYLLNVEEGKPRRLTFQGRYNTAPQWSPRGDYIAYTGLGELGHMDIYLISPEGRGPIQLTRDAGNNESPTWSPDGSLIAFSSTRSGRSTIFVMNANGENQRPLLTLGGEQTDPCWSPRLSGR